MYADVSRQYKPGVVLTVECATNIDGISPAYNGASYDFSTSQSYRSDTHSAETIL